MGLGLVVAPASRNEMEARIHAINAENDGPHADLWEGGNVTRSKPERFEILVHGGKLTIHAKSEEASSDGSRGGTPTKTVHRLIIEFGPNELKRIIREAAKGKLLSPPGLDHVIEAKTHLQQAADELGLAAKTLDKLDLGG